MGAINAAEFSAPDCEVAALGGLVLAINPTRRATA
jgi:hypothetical protein